MSVSWAVIDLGFGDSGKGRVVDLLCRRHAPGWVVRWHGGAQAGHRVVDPDGRAHVFAQVGAGAFVPGVATLLGPRFLLHPLALAVERRRLAALGLGGHRLVLHHDALVITPYHQAANRLREAARGPARHGSCGLGIGEAARLASLDPGLALRARDLATPRVARARLDAIRAALGAELAPLLAAEQAETQAADAAPGLPAAAAEARALWADAGAPTAWLGAASAAVLPLQRVDDDDLRSLFGDQRLVFEGAQGMLLDEGRGLHPHTTWSTVSGAEVRRLLDHSGRSGEPLRTVGVLRRWPSRHGAGPFPTEDPALAALPEAENVDGPHQGAFRQGEPDLVLARYAVAACAADGPPIDGLALTGLDRRPPAPRDRWCAAWQVDGQRLGQLPLGAHGDLAHQSALCGLARRAAPVWAPAPAGEAFAPAFAEALGLPLVVATRGPRAGEEVGGG